ncbi:MAG: AAA family ATPase [Clostridiales bacterium]|nr:AAA family ATPase [Clostridiales bacterium]
MNYVGKTVRHKKYDEGVVVEQEGDYLYVQFTEQDEKKRFRAPACFQTSLQLFDEAAAAAAHAENLAREERTRREENEQRIRRKAEAFERRIRLREAVVSEKSAHVRSYSTLGAFFDEQERLLQAEIKTLRDGGGKRMRVVDGHLIEFKSSHYLYSFESDLELNLPDNTQITIWQGQQSLQGHIVNCEDFAVIISCEQFLGQTVPVLEFSAEPWQLLNALVDRLKTLRQRPTDITSALILDGMKKVQYDQPVQMGQNTARQMSHQQPITFIWGPPGTGKTQTLAEIAVEHIKRSHRVLMLSHSNVSVDQAILRVFEKARQMKPGTLVRYGYPRGKELLQHEYLTSYHLALYNHPDLQKECTALIQERQRLPRTSPLYVQATTRLKQIRNQLVDEEKQIVGQAMFVATTVSKAVVDKTLYESSFDVVIFDEASMAYIPQIVFSAGLARHHFICIGDFSQLPPIVQSKDASHLSTDIFQHCGIVDAVEAGYGHEWLCLLDTQHRMYPDIAQFSSKTMYRRLLKSACDMHAKTRPIVDAAPFPGNALCLVDLSGMMSVCMKTADSSRINVLSALIAMSIATVAARSHEVGIITPYHAQSRLLHAMARDVQEMGAGLQPITCATVHQFQGSEMEVIVYDAVDCYIMTHPGVMLSSTENNYANRLYNVAVTRAKGKVITIANADFMKTKKLSRKLIFRQMLDDLTGSQACIDGAGLQGEMHSEVCKWYDIHDGNEQFMIDLCSAKREVRMELPGGISFFPQRDERMAAAIASAKERGVKVYIRAASKADLPELLQPLAVENRFVHNPICLIDRKIVWFGEPMSSKDFVADGAVIPTRYRPIIRFNGRRLADALFGFLEMNKTVDEALALPAADGKTRYSTFASYVNATEKCRECGSPMKLKKSRSGKFFLACTAYPGCESTRLVETDLVDSYLYHEGEFGKTCQRDKTSLEAKLGRYGVYVSCCNIDRHTYRLDEI